MGGAAVNRVLRMGAEGILDSGFTGKGANGRVLALALQADGKAVIGGWFTGYRGLPRQRLARLNTDGSVDTTFDPGSGPAGAPYALALQADGKVLLGGTFTSVNGTAVNRLARLNADGSFDSTFDTGTGVNGYVHSVLVQPDGRILIGGAFSTYNGVVRNHVARLRPDGSLDPSFNPGSGTLGLVYAMVLAADGRLVIGGDFTAVNGVSRSGLARLNADGGLDMTFAPGGGTNGAVRSLLLQADGRLVVGGDFTGYDGQAVNRLLRVTANGALDNGFNPGSGADAVVRSLALAGDGTVVVAGDFTQYNGASANRLVQIQTGDPDQDGIGNALDAFPQDPLRW